MARRVWAGFAAWALGTVAVAATSPGPGGEPIELAGPLRFDDEEELAAESLPALDALARFLGEHPEMIAVEVAASVAGPGPRQELVALAEDRAETVIEQLIQRGVASRRLLSRGLVAKGGRGPGVMVRVLTREGAGQVPPVPSTAAKTPPEAAPVPAAVTAPVAPTAATAPTAPTATTSPTAATAANPSLRARVGAGVIELDGVVRFKQQLDELTPESLPLLDDVAALLRAERRLGRVRVEGHTDRLGSRRENLLLSQKRAEAVVAYLVERGVARKRLVAKGYGEARPVAPNDTREGREQNRRVAFTVLR